MKQRIRVTLVGVTAVVAYAVVMALQALVLDPLAAVPGRSLDQISAHLVADGMDVRADVISVSVTAAIGVALALGAAILGLRQRFPPLVLSMMFLSILAFGAFATFGCGFALGMDVADAYGVDGASHTVWAGVLYATSFVALLGIPAVLIVAIRRGRPDATSLASEA